MDDSNVIEALQRFADIDDPELDALKQCKTCERFLELRMFRRWNQSPDGHLYTCMECDGLHERLGNYRITVRQFILILQRQGWIDPVCGRLLTPATASVDHDHLCCKKDGSCGKCVRGALCVECNAGMGLLGDDPVRMLAGYKYLTQRYAVPPKEGYRRA